MMKSRFKLLGFLCLMALLLMVNTGEVRAQVVPEGVHVCDMDLGGLELEEAGSMIENYVQAIEADSLTMTLANRSFDIPYADFDMHVMEHTIMEDIASIGNQGSLLRRYKELTDAKNGKLDYTIPFEYNGAKLLEQVTAVAATSDSEVADATIVRHDGELIITDEVYGARVDVNATVAAVKAAMGENWQGEKLSVPMVAELTDPVHTRAELEVIQDVLGTYSTSYSGSSSNRISNIANGASFIDELVMYPGDEFSFLEHVTPFTTGNGYLQATGYSGGKVVPSIGGGICQVSSTLYNAVVRAELEILERSNHGMTVGYVPLGADATVAEGSVDFRFRNDKDTPIYIEAYTYSGSVYVTIYGQEDRPENRKLEFNSFTESTIAPGDDVVTEDPTEPEGYMVVNQSAHTGYVASFYKYIYVDGELTDKVKLNTSTYRSSPRYVTVGTMKEDVDDGEDADEDYDDDED